MSNHFDDDHDHGFDDEPFGSYPRPRGSDHSDFNRRILLTAVVSLSLVLVLVFALHLYARFILRRQARRRAAIHQLSLTVAHAHAHSTEPPNTGLDPTLIATLPTFLFKRKEPQQKQQQEENHHHGDASMVECAVCLSVLEDEEMVRLLPNCKHTFHVGCIDTWLASHSTCPVCRTKVEPRLEPQPREGPTGLALHGGEAPSAPLLFEPPTEGTSDSTIAGSPKMNSRLTSFRRILTRERSSRRIQPSSCDNIDQDLERQ